jgi:hypothetical protein
MSTDINRRAILAGAAALPATALPAIAAEPDPIIDHTSLGGASSVRGTVRPRIREQFERPGGAQADVISCGGVEDAELCLFFQSSHLFALSQCQSIPMSEFTSELTDVQIGAAFRRGFGEVSFSSRAGESAPWPSHV